MPTYEYLCEANRRVVEVNHRMADKVKNWGDLCQRAAIPVGKTNPKAKVTKLMSASFVGRTASENPACEMPGCGAGGCGSGLCDLQ